jgi:hypothetical protein
MMTADDQPQPAPPMAGTPKCPYMKTQLSGALRISPSRLSTITGRGRPMPVVKPKKTRKNSTPGTAQATPSR